MTCPDPRTITKSLVEERLNGGMTRDELAERIGVTGRVLQLAERGVTPRPRNALKIASFFGCQVTDLWPVDDQEREVV